MKRSVADDINRWVKRQQDGSKQSHYSKLAKHIEEYKTEEALRNRSGQAIPEQTNQQREEFHKKNNVYSLEGLTKKMQKYLGDFEDLSSETAKNACAASLADIFHNCKAYKLLDTLKKQGLENNIETIKDYRSTLVHTTNNRMRGKNVTPAQAREEIVKNARIILNKISPKKEPLSTEQSLDLLTQAAKESEKAVPQYKPQIQPHANPQAYVYQLVQPLSQIYFDPQTNRPYYYDTVTNQSYWAEMYVAPQQAQNTIQTPAPVASPAKVSEAPHQNLSPQKVPVKNKENTPPVSPVKPTYGPHSERAVEEEQSKRNGLSGYFDYLN